jgi:hypothetical protein
MWMNYTVAVKTVKDGTKMFSLFLSNRIMTSILLIVLRQRATTNSEIWGEILEKVSFVKLLTFQPQASTINKAAIPTKL